MTDPLVPADIPPDLAQAIGQLASNWASLEIVLDMLVAVMFHKADGAAKNPRIPISLKAKSELIKMCLRDFPALAAYQARGRDLITEINGLSNDRNFVLHGMVWSGKPDAMNRYEFRKFQFSDKAKHKLVNKRLSAYQINEMAKAMYRVRLETLKFLLEIGESALNLWIDETTP